jgi:hypothetical protein
VENDKAAWSAAHSLDRLEPVDCAPDCYSPNCLYAVVCKQRIEEERWRAIACDLPYTGGI